MLPPQIKRSLTVWLSWLFPSIRLEWFNFHALHWTMYCTSNSQHFCVLKNPRWRWSCFVFGTDSRRHKSRQKNLLSCRDPMCSGTAHWLCIGILVIVGSHFDLSLRFPGGDLDRRGVKLATKYFRRRKQWLCTPCTSNSYHQRRKFALLS